MTPVFSKILERVMCNRLMDFLDRNETLYKYQFDFLDKHSTNNAISILIDKIARHSVVIGVALDFRKAFDTLNYNILLRKLYKLCIRGTCYDWLNSYIYNIKQYICYANSTSKLLDVYYNKFKDIRRENRENLVREESAHR